MAILNIDYSDLGKIEKYAKDAAEKAGAYSSDLSKKSASKIDKLSSTSNINSAKYYVDQKIKALNAKKTSFENFGKQIHDFSETAKRVDGEVKTMMVSSQYAFYSAHTDLKIDDWKAALINWFTDLKNSCPLFELIGNLFNGMENFFSDVAANIKYWYECEGGKEKIAFALAIAGAVVAVLLFIAAFPASTFFAICAAIGAAITMVNAITNVFTSYRAMKAAKDGDPAWAKIYGKQDKLSDVLRQTNFKNGVLNRLSYIGATTLDVTEFAVGVINLVHGIGELKSKFTCIQNYFDKNNGGLFTYFKEAEWHEVLDWDESGHAIGTKWEMVTNEQGIVQTKFTPGSIWRGTKAFVLNQPVTPHSDQGLRTVLNQNFVIDFKTTFKTYFSPGSWKDTFRYNFTDGGRNSYELMKNSYSWQGFKDTLRYNIKNNPVKGLLKTRNTSYAKIIAGDINTLKSGFSTLEQIATGKYDLGNTFKEKTIGQSDFYQFYEKLNKSSKTFPKLITESYPFRSAILAS